MSLRAKRSNLARILAVFLALSLALPNPAFALRTEQKQEANPKGLADEIKPPVRLAQLAPPVPTKPPTPVTPLIPAAGLEEVVSKLAEFRHLAVQIRRQVQDEREDFAGSLRRILAEYPGSVEQKLLGEPKVSEEGLLYVIVGDKGLSQMKDLELSDRYLTSPFAHENLRILPMVISTIHRMMVDSGKVATTPDAVILNMDLGDTRTALSLAEQRALISHVLEVIRSSTAAGLEEKGGQRGPVVIIQPGHSLYPSLVESSAGPAGFSSKAMGGVLRHLRRKKLRVALRIQAPDRQVRQKWSQLGFQSAGPEPVALTELLEKEAAWPPRVLPPLDSKQDVAELVFKGSSLGTVQIRPAAGDWMTYAGLPAQFVKWVENLRAAESEMPEIPARGPQHPSKEEFFQRLGTLLQQGRLFSPDFPLVLPGFDEKNFFLEHLRQQGGPSLWDEVLVSEQERQVLEQLEADRRSRRELERISAELAGESAQARKELRAALDSRIASMIEPHPDVLNRVRVRIRRLKAGGFVEPQMKAGRSGEEAAREARVSLLRHRREMEDQIERLPERAGKFAEYLKKFEAALRQPDHARLIHVADAIMAPGSLGGEHAGPDVAKALDRWARAVAEVDDFLASQDSPPPELRNSLLLWQVRAVGLLAYGHALDAGTAERFIERNPFHHRVWVDLIGNLSGNFMKKRSPRERDAFRNSYVLLGWLAPSDGFGPAQSDRRFSAILWDQSGQILNNPIAAKGSRLPQYNWMAAKGSRFPQSQGLFRRQIQQGLYGAVSQLGEVPRALKRDLLLGKSAAARKLDDVFDEAASVVATWLSGSGRSEAESLLERARHYKMMGGTDPEWSDWKPRLDPELIDVEGWRYLFSRELEDLDWNESYLAGWIAALPELNLAGENLGKREQELLAASHTLPDWTKQQQEAWDTDRRGMERVLSNARLRLTGPRQGADAASLEKLIAEVEGMSQTVDQRLQAYEQKVRGFVDQVQRQTGQSAGLEERTPAKMSEAVREFRVERDPASVIQNVGYYLEGGGVAFAPVLALLEARKDLNPYSFAGVVEKAEDKKRLLVITESDAKAHELILTQLFVVEEQEGAGRGEKHENAKAAAFRQLLGTEIRTIDRLETDLLAQLNNILASFGCRLPEDTTVQKAALALLQAA